MKHNMNGLPMELSVALVTTNLWLLMLWIIDYPVGEWIGVVVIWYVSYMVARLVVANSTLPLVIWLGNHARRLAEQLDIDIDSYSTKRPVAIVVTVVLVMIATVLGLSFTTTNMVLSLTGLTPLGFTFNTVAWALLSIGLLVQVVFFARSYLIFRLAESLIKQSRGEMDSHQNITKLLGILHRISHGDINLGLPQPWLSALRLPLT